MDAIRIRTVDASVAGLQETVDYALWRVAAVVVVLMALATVFAVVGYRLTVGRTDSRPKSPHAPPDLPSPPSQSVRRTCESPCGHGRGAAAGCPAEWQSRVCMPAVRAASSSAATSETNSTLAAGIPIAAAIRR